MIVLHDISRVEGQDGIRQSGHGPARGVQPIFSPQAFGCGQIASMRFERVEMFAEFSDWRSKKNIYASPPSGGGGMAWRGVMEEQSRGGSPDATIASAKYRSTST